MFLQNTHDKQPFANSCDEGYNHDITANTTIKCGSKKCLQHTLALLSFLCVCGQTERLWRGKSRATRAASEQVITAVIPRTKAISWWRRRALIAGKASLAKAYGEIHGRSRQTMSPCRSRQGGRNPSSAPGRVPGLI